MNLYKYHKHPLRHFSVRYFANAEMAYEYLKKHGMGNLEPSTIDKILSIIIKSPEYSFRTAKNVLRRPWPEAEKTIIKDSWFASMYATDVLKHRWEEAESVIFSDEDSAYSYLASFDFRKHK